MLMCGYESKELFMTGFFVLRWLIFVLRWLIFVFTVFPDFSEIVEFCVNLIQQSVRTNKVKLFVQKSVIVYVVSMF